MKYLNVLMLVVILCGCNTLRTKIDQSQERPNILIIYPDQLRRYSAGFWSRPEYRDYCVGKPDPVYTPNIDRLASNGVVLTQAISNFPLCSPGRGMLLSGAYPQSNGIWNNCKVGRDESLKSDIPTITDFFYSEGYNTAYFGKCHWLRNTPLFDKNKNYVGTTDPPGGHHMNKFDTYIPPGADRHHIEYFYQSIKDDHFNPLVYSNIPETIDGRKDGELFMPGVFSPKNESEKIISYLKNENNERDSNKPFCLIWSINPPHNPWTDKNTDMDVLRRFYDTDKFPQVDTNLVVRKNADLNVARYARNYFANVSSIDYYLGTVVDELEQQGMLENTIIFFSSDHGEMLGSHGKKGKNNLFTEALAIPGIIHYPPKLSKGIKEMIFSMTDIFPTILGLAGFEEIIPPTIEGRNWAWELQEANTASLQTSTLVMLHNTRGIFNGRYTLGLEEDTANGELINTFLYDNEKDPYQLNQLMLEDYPDIVAHLMQDLGRILKRVDDPWYMEKKYAKIITYPE